MITEMVTVYRDTLGYVEGTDPDKYGKMIQAEETMTLDNVANTIHRHMAELTNLERGYVQLITLELCTLIKDDGADHSKTVGAVMSILEDNEIRDMIIQLMELRSNGSLL